MLEDFKLKIKGYVAKLRGLSENKKKIILWITVAVLGIIMGYFWVKSVIYKLNNLESINLNIELPENFADNSQSLENNKAQ